MPYTLTQTAITPRQQGSIAAPYVAQATFAGTPRWLRVIDEDGQLIIYAYVEPGEPERDKEFVIVREGQTYDPGIHHMLVGTVLQDGELVSVFSNGGQRV